MGAGNVKLAFGHYAGKVPPASLLALAYMALIALDNDDPPKFWGGYDTIASGAFGRPTFGKAESKVIARAMTPLFRVGAVEVDRRSAPGRQARYRLNLHPANAPRKPGGVSDERTPETGNRSGQRTPETVPTHPGNRGAEEEQEELKQDVGLKAGVMKADLRNERSGGRAAEHGDDQDRDSSMTGRETARRPPATCGGCGAYLDPDGSCFACGTRRSA